MGTASHSNPCRTKYFVSILGIVDGNALNRNAHLGAGLVGGVLGHATIGIHGGEVERTVQATREVGYIDVEGEFVANEIEGLVALIILGHQVDTGADVLAGDEGESQGVARGGDAVSALVVGTIQSAIRGASLIVRAKRLIPLSNPCQFLRTLPLFTLCNLTVFPV